jgi:GDPmannose 4,6-dehydratase
LRDWGHARDYVKAQWLMLQQPEAEDFVIATGRQYSVRDFVRAAAAKLEMVLEWHGAGVEEQAVDSRTGRTVVKVDPRYFRPTEVETLLGDPRKANEKLGWVAETPFDELVSEMVESDWELAKRDAMVSKAGFRTLRQHE